MHCLDKYACVLKTLSYQEVLLVFPLIKYNLHVYVLQKGMPCRGPTREFIIIKQNLKYKLLKTF